MSIIVIETEKLFPAISLSFGKYSYVRLADLKPNLLNYLEGEGNIQKHLIEVFVLIVDWIEDRPEDRESGDQLREEIVREFNESCSLHFLIEHDLTGDSTYLNSASYFNTIELKYELIDFLINQALNCYGSHRTALHLAASTRNVNMLQYLIYEKDVYLYAVYKNFHTFYDVLIMSRQLVANTEDNRKSIIQKLISNLAHVMLLKPLKTLCAEKIVNNSSLLESARNKLGGCSKLMQLFSLHSTS